MVQFKSCSKRVLATVLSVVMLIGMLPAILLPAAADTGVGTDPGTEITATHIGSNLLSNSGFESTSWGSPANWSTISSSTSSSRQSNTVLSGSYAGQIKRATSLSSPNRLGIYSSSVSVTGGATYEFGVSVHSPNTATSLAYAALVQSTGTTTWSTAVQGSTANWTKLSGIITLDPATTSVTLYIYFYNTDESTNTDTWYVDDAFLYQTTAQLVTSSDSTLNASFDSNINTWALHQRRAASDAGIPTAAFRQATNVYRSGSGSLYVGKDSQASDVYVDSSVKMAVTAGEEYSWGLWYTSHDSTVSARLDVVLYNADGTQIGTLSGREFMLSRGDTLSAWKQVATTMAMPANAAYASFRLVLPSGRAQLFVDDVFAYQTTGKTYVGTVTNGAEVSVNELLPAYTYSANMAGSLAFTDLNGQSLTGITVTAGQEFTVPSAAITSTFTPSASGQLEITQVYTPIVDDAGWTAQVGWYPEKEQNSGTPSLTYYRVQFNVTKKVTKAVAQLAASNGIKGFYINNAGGFSFTDTALTGINAHKRLPSRYVDVTANIVTGSNVLATAAYHTGDGNAAGLIAQIDVVYADGTTERFGTGLSNTTTTVSKMTVAAGDDPDTIVGNNQGTGWYLISDGSGWSWVPAQLRGVPPLSGGIGSIAYEWSCNFVAERPSLKPTATKTFSGTAGQKVTATLPCVNIDGTVGDTIRARLYMGDTYYATVVLSTKIDATGVADGNGLLVMTMTAPDYLPAGTYTVKPYACDLALTDAASDSLFTLTLSAAGKSAATAQVGPDTNGAVRLTVNGSSCSPVMYLRTFAQAAGYYDYDELKTFAASGIKLYGTYGGMLGNVGTTGATAIWNEDGSINTAALDKEVYEILDINPNAMVLFSIDMDAPDWWKTANPGECYTYTDNNGVAGQTAVSWASTKYRTEATAVVEKIVTYLYNTAPYRHRLFGVRFTGGNTYEWLMEGMHQGEFDGTDAMVNALNTKLGTSYTADQIKTYTTTAGNIALIDTTTTAGQVAYAYHQLLSQSITDSILAYATAAKTVTGSKWITGAYNGYLWNFDSAEALGAAHTTVDDLLESTAIDFISSPVTYGERTEGYYPTGMALSESVQAHGKLYMLEQDNRTMLTKAGNSEANSVGQADTTKDTVDQLIRDTTVDMVKNNGFWMLDMNGGWFNSPAITSALAQVKQEYDVSLSLNTSSNSEIAVIVGDDTYDYFYDGLLAGNDSYSAYLLEALYTKQRQELAKLGTSYDTLALSDLEHADLDLSSYKLIVVLSPFGMTTAQADLLKNNNRTVLWVYLPGGAANVSAITGMTVSVGDDLAPMQATYTANGDTYTFGTSSIATGPKATVSGGTTLATYPDGSAAVASVAGSGYTSVYAAVPGVPAALLRELADAAGVHRYINDKDAIVETNDSYVSVTALNAGTQTITLPAAKYAYNVYTGESYGSVSSIDVSLDANETALIRVTDEDTSTVTQTPSDHTPSTYPRPDVPDAYANIVSTNGDFSNGVTGQYVSSSSLITGVDGMAKFTGNSYMTVYTKGAVPGYTYTFSMWYWLTDAVNSNGNKPQFLIQGHTNGSSGNYKSKYVTGMTNMNGWTQLTWEYTVPESADATALYFDIFSIEKASSAGVSGTLYVDDITVYNPNVASTDPVYIGIDYADPNDTLFDMTKDTNNNRVSLILKSDSTFPIANYATYSNNYFNILLDGVATQVFSGGAGHANRLVIYVGNSATYLDAVSEIVIPAGTSFYKDNTIVYFVQDFVLEQENGVWLKKVNITDHTTLPESEDGGVHVPATVIGDNLITDGSFTGSTGNFSLNGNALGENNATLEITQQYVQRTISGLTPGATYELSYYVWINNIGTGSFAHDIYTTGSASPKGGWLDYTLKNAATYGAVASTTTMTAVTNGWQLVTLEWTVPTGSDGTVHIGFKTYSGSAYSFHIDDVALYMTAAPETYFDVDNTDTVGSMGYNGGATRSFFIITNTEGNFPESGWDAYNSGSFTIMIDGLPVKASAAGMGASALNQLQIMVNDTDYSDGSISLYADTDAREIIIPAGIEFYRTASPKEIVRVTEEIRLLKINGTWTQIGTDVSVVDFNMTDTNDVVQSSGYNDGGRSYIILQSDEIINNNANAWANYANITAVIDGRNTTVGIYGNGGSATNQLGIYIWDSNYQAAGGTGNSHTNAKSVVIPAGTIVKISDTLIVRFPQDYTIIKDSYWHKANTVLMGATATLSDRVILNFHVYTPTNVATNYGVKVKFTYTTRDGEVTEWVSIDRSNVDANGYYLFPIKLVAAYMATDIRAEVGYGNTDAFTVEHSMNYSIRDYGQALITGPYDASYKNVAKAMLNYGAWAQSYFGWNTADPANSVLADADKVSDVDAGLALIGNIDQYKATTADKLDSFVGYSLLLKDGTAMRLYFRQQVTVTVDGAEVEVVKDDDSSYYYAEIAGVGAGALDTAHTVTASDGNGTMTITNLSVLTPARTVARSASKSDNFRKLMISLIVYAQRVNEL